MDAQQQPTGRRTPRIKPHRLQHPTARRRKPILRSKPLRPDARPQPAIVEPADINATQALLRRHRTRPRHLKAPLAPRRHIQPQPQRIMMIKHSLQGCQQIRFPQTRRNPQQHRLVEMLDRTAAIPQPAHDRRQRQRPARHVRKPRRRSRRNRRRRRQSHNRLMLEHRPRRDQKTRLAGPAHQLDRHDAVAAERKEIVVNADPLNPEHLGKQPAQDLLLRRPRTAHNRRRQIRRRKRLAVELAVRRQRQGSQNNKRRRNHVVRKRRRKLPPQRRHIHRPIRRRNHIGHQPLLTRLILPRQHHRLRNTSMTRQRSLDLARLNAETAHLHLLVGTPQKLQHTVRTPARKVPAAVHPAPRRTKRVRNKPLPGQTRTPHIAPRNPQARNVKAPPATPAGTGSRPPSKT